MPTVKKSKMERVLNARNRKRQQREEKREDGRKRENPVQDVQERAGQKVVEDYYHLNFDMAI